MVTHESIWGAIEALARRSGATMSGLAVRAGLDPTALNRSKRIGADGKPHWPSSRTIAQLLQATGMSFRDFCNLVEPPEAPRAGQARADILVVDDAAEIRDSFAEVLRRAGYRVHAAASHREVLDLLDGAQPVDLLCTDIVMPEGLGGVALARLARVRRPALQVLYITGYDIPALEQQRGPRVMRKPVAAQSLLDAVEQALAAARAPESGIHH
jgi:CheY-like chemotaxis protein